MMKYALAAAWSLVSSSAWATDGISTELAVGLQVATFCLTIGGMVIVLGNSRSKVTADLGKSISSHARELHLKFDDHQKIDVGEFKAVRAEVNLEFDRVQERTGELGHSLVQRINDMKDWTRDNCVLEKNFQVAHSTVMNSLGAMDQKADARASVLEARLIAVERNQQATEAARAELMLRVVALEKTARNGHHQR